MNPLNRHSERVDSHGNGNSNRRVNENRIVIRVCSRQNHNIGLREFEFAVGIRALFYRLMLKP